MVSQYIRMLLSYSTDSKVQESIAQHKSGASNNRGTQGDKSEVCNRSK